jgi:hypothetical protein
MLAQADTWPVVEPAHEKHTVLHVDAADVDTPVFVMIQDLRGKPVYKLECYNEAYENESE